MQCVEIVKGMDRQLKVQEFRCDSGLSSIFYDFLEFSMS